MNAVDVDRLLGDRLLVTVPREDLARKADYEEWADLDQLVLRTGMALGNEDEATAVISLEGRSLLHLPCLDLDVPAWLDDGVLHVRGRDADESTWERFVHAVDLIPSGTPGHQHAYINDHSLTWGEYAELLEELRDAGVLGKGWVALSLRRGFTLLRHPNHPKIVPIEDQF